MEEPCVMGLRVSFCFIFRGGDVWELDLDCWCCCGRVTLLVRRLGGGIGAGER